MKIGLFDSGIGGLMILKEIFKLLPQYDYVYLGDTENFPYGEKTKKEIYQFTKKAVQFLFDQDCLLVILACNTATSNALKKIQQKFLIKNFPKHKVLGIIIPTIEEIEKEHRQKIGIIATKATVKSKSFIEEIKKNFPRTIIFQNPAPKLIGLIEKENTESDKIIKYIEEYTRPLLKKGIDSLILGCTHYGLIENKIKKVVGEKIKIIGQEKIIAEKLKDYLKRHPEIKEKIGKNKKREYFLTKVDYFYYSKFRFFLGNFFKKKDKLKIGYYSRR